MTTVKKGRFVLRNRGRFYENLEEYNQLEREFYSRLNPVDVYSGDEDDYKRSSSKRKGSSTEENEEHHVNQQVNNGEKTKKFPKKTIDFDERKADQDEDVNVNQANDNDVENNQNESNGNEDNNDEQDEQDSDEDGDQQGDGQDDEYNEDDDNEDGREEQDDDEDGQYDESSDGEWEEESSESDEDYTEEESEWEDDHDEQLHMVRDQAQEVINSFSYNKFKGLVFAESDPAELIQTYSIPSGKWKPIFKANLASKLSDVAQIFEIDADEYVKSNVNGTLPEREMKLTEQQKNLLIEKSNIGENGQKNKDVGVIHSRPFPFCDSRGEINQIYIDLGIRRATIDIPTFVPTKIRTVKDGDSAKDERETFFMIMHGQLSGIPIKKIDNSMISILAQVRYKKLHSLIKYVWQRGGLRHENNRMLLLKIFGVPLKFGVRQESVDLTGELPIISDAPMTNSSQIGEITEADMPDNWIAHINKCLQTIPDF